METLTIDAKEFQTVFRDLKSWARKGYREDLNQASLEMVKDYKKKIGRGVDGAGNRLRDVKDVTMESPIRYSTDKAIRGEVNPSKKPLIARGRAVSSINRIRVARDRIEIKPTTQHGKVVFSHNASGGGAKTVRDPLIVSRIQENIIEKHILKGIDNAIRR